MKYIFILLLFAVPFSAMSQNRSVKKFYRAYKHQENTHNMVIPGWLIHIGTGISKWFVKEPEAREALKFARHFKRFRLLVMEDQNAVQGSDISRLINGARKESYDDFIQVREGNTRVTFMIREKKDTIRNMLIVVSEEDEFVMLDLKSKLKIEHINQLLRTLSKDMDIDIPIKTPEPAPPKERPQV